MFWNHRNLLRLFAQSSSSGPLWGLSIRADFSLDFIHVGAHRLQEGFPGVGDVEEVLYLHQELRHAIFCNVEQRYLS